MLKCSLIPDIPNEAVGTGPHLKLQNHLHLVRTSNLSLLTSLAAGQTSELLGKHNLPLPNKPPKSVTSGAGPYPCIGQDGISDFKASSGLENHW